jgi:hypothetical protein
MKRHLLTLVLSGLVGSLVLAGDAQACHKKKCTCAAAPTCAVAAPAPCAAPAPVCEPTCAAPKKHCGLLAHFKGIKLGCHKKAAGCAAPVAAPCGETIAYSAPVSYSAPVTYSAPAVYSSPQVSAQH